jgi:hypothetical protein
MMIRTELEDMLKKCTYCVMDCKQGKEDCPACKNRIDTDDIYRLLKSHGELLWALKTLHGALEVYDPEIYASIDYASKKDEAVTTATPPKNIVCPSCYTSGVGQFRAEIVEKTNGGLVKFHCSHCGATFENFAKRKEADGV